jgi:DNA-directed RNA polymerase specialized sigma24 family protein
MPLELIASRLQLPLGTVKSRLHYALKLLGPEIDR